MSVTIAILPFKKLVATTHNEMLIDGFVDDLVINISKFVGVSVLASETIKKWDAKKDQLENLGADYLVNGSFREFNANFRFGIQLIRQHDYTIIFAKDYDFSFDHLFEIHDTVLMEVINALRQQMDYDLLSFSYKRRATDLRAYESYLLGMNTMKRGGVEHDMEAREHFRSALKVDPNYARAYTGISLSYFNEWSCQIMDQWDITKNGAQEYALKALELDESDYVALTVAGRTYLFSNEFEKAEHYLRKSIRMNPNDASNLIQVAFCFIFLGHAEEAVTLYEKACKLNPLHPDSYYAYGQNIYFEAGRFDKALELGEKVNIQTSFVDFAAYMAAAYYHTRDFDKMTRYWGEYLKKFGKTILKTGEINPKDALIWQAKVNPYRQGTYLEPFWEHIAKEQGNHLQFQSGQESVHAEPRNRSNMFQRKGDLWEFSYANQTVMVQNLKGFSDIVLLMQRPEEEIHCSELIGSVVVNEKGFELIDQKAKKDYQKKILELQEDIGHAEKSNDYVNVARLQNEYDQILEHLSSSLGLAGKARKSATQIDKARSAVTWRIRNSIKKLEEYHPTLAKHLSLSIKTGTFCSYKPETPTDWLF